jgi:hypothetical protein
MFKLLHVPQMVCSLCAWHMQRLSRTILPVSDVPALLPPAAAAVAMAAFLLLLPPLAAALALLQGATPDQR